jgi:hypothetical protein
MSTQVPVLTQQIPIQFAPSPPPGGYPIEMSNLWQAEMGDDKSGTPTPPAELDVTRNGPLYVARYPERTCQMKMIPRAN